ncbi:MAG: META domain-containing protein [Methyloceanibacter sp.]
MGTAIQIGPLASTRKGCLATMTLEMAFFAALRSQNRSSRTETPWSCSTRWAASSRKFVRVEGT